MSAKKSNPKKVIAWGNQPQQQHGDWRNDRKQNSLEYFYLVDRKFVFESPLNEAPWTFEKTVQIYLINVGG